MLEVIHDESDSLLPWRVSDGVTGEVWGRPDEASAHSLMASMEKRRAPRVAVPRKNYECASPVQGETPFELALRLETRLRRALRSACLAAAGDGSLADDAWSDVVLERIHRIVELWDPARSPNIDGYVVRTIKMYAHKWARFKSGRVWVSNQRQSQESCSFEATPARASSDARVEVSLIMAQLSTYDQWLITQRLLEGYTFGEMAESSGTSRVSMRIHFRQAVERARALVRESHR